MKSKKFKTEYVRVISLNGALYVLIPHDYAVQNNIKRADYLKRIRKDGGLEYKKLMEEEE